MKLLTLACFDEADPRSWRWATVIVLVLSIVAFGVNSDFSVRLSAINLGAALIAGLLSVLLGSQPILRIPGSLSIWLLCVGTAWLWPDVGLDVATKSWIFFFTIVAISFAFQGPLAMFIGVQLFFSGLQLEGLGTNLSESLFLFLGGLILGSTIYCARVATTRAGVFRENVHTVSDLLEGARQKVATSAETVLLTRERLLGRTHSEDATQIESQLGEPLGTQLNEPHVAAFEDLIARLRRSFADYQAKGRANGRISGPIRFVFLAPVAGYDEKSLIAIDLEKFANDLEVCFDLGLEALPEIGSRKREGVIRLSVRYGLRKVEVSVEDNGRGTMAPNQRIGERFNLLKTHVQSWGGEFDRITRLGVGSRTSIELRVVQERVYAHRAPHMYRLVRPETAINGPNGPTVGAPLG